MLEVSSFSQLLELLDLFQESLHFFVGLLSVRFLSLEKALSHQNNQYPWEDQQISYHRKISREVLDVAQLNDEAADEGLESKRKGRDDWVRKHACHKEDGDHLTEC